MFGHTSEFGGSVPVAGVAGDQQAALYGQACQERGLGKNTYGTGSFVLQNAGAELPEPAEGLLTTIAWGVEGRVDYALEAAIFVTGAAVQWLRDALGVIRSADETEELARSLDSNDGVYLVPAFAGLGSPHWDPYARGTIVGLTRGAGRAHLARAALEAMAYQTVDALRAMEAASGVTLERAQGRRRGGRQRLADEVPGRRAGRAGRRAGDLGDDRARRRLPRRRGDGRLDGGGRAGDVDARPRATSPRCRRTSASPCSRAGSDALARAASNEAAADRVGRPQMKAQVYKDPRPAEHFTRFHERTRSRRPDWVYERRPHRAHAVPAALLPRALHRLAQHPGRRAR